MFGADTLRQRIRSQQDTFPTGYVQDRILSDEDMFGADMFGADTFGADTFRKDTK